MIPAIRIRIDFSDNVNLGPGKIALLEAIRSTGSISDAARSLGMSYRRAWLLVNSLKEGFSEAVTVSAAAGTGIYLRQQGGSAGDIVFSKIRVTSN